MIGRALSFQHGEMHHRGIGAHHLQPAATQPPATCITPR
jgi:hypothetical protein